MTSQKTFGGLATQSSKLRANNASMTTTTKREEKSQSEFWTTEAFIDELFLCLAGVKEYVTNKENSKQVTVRKYYHQARNLMKWIPIVKPSPPFVIYISDLTPNVKDRLDELARTYKDTLTYTLKQSVGRIFENLDFDYYHLSIARNLKVRLEKK